MGPDVLETTFVDHHVDDDPLSVVAAVAARYSQAVGLPMPAALSDVRPAALDAVKLPESFSSPDGLGRLWESLIASDARQAQGAHFTPARVADHLVSLTLARLHSAAELPVVVDPTVGGGAFLLAAARWLELHHGAARPDIVRRLYGADLDVGAAAVADAALELWAGGEVRANIAVADTLIDLPPQWPSAFDAVVGNPPFLSQLAHATARDAERSAILAERYGHAMGYADDAAVFARRAIDLVRHLGVVGLVLPQSVLGAANAQPLRHGIHERAHLAELWIDGSQVFGAAVDVVGAVFVRGSTAEATSVSVGFDSNVDSVPTPEPTSWAPLLASARGVPAVKLRSSEVLGDRATVTAGFRQHFYGIADAVREDDGSEASSLVTAGAIDPLRPRWGERAIKFAGNRYERPVLDLESIEDAAVRGWFEARLRPKVLVATQTRVVEAIADPDGSVVPSVPVIVVEPFDPDPMEVWRLAALLTTPLISASLAAKNAGTGLSSTAIRVRAADLIALPVPEDVARWNAAAETARRTQEADSSNARELLIDEVAVAMTEAFGDQSDALEWWRGEVGFSASR